MRRRRRAAGNRLGTVPVALFRERFLALGLRPYELADRLDWRDYRGKLDSGRVTRAVGLRPYRASGRDRRWICQERVGLGMAAQLCRALELDPYEVGI